MLGYVNYRHFLAVIEKARTACFNSGQRVEDHFVGSDEMIEIGKGGQRPVQTMMMSRYACYLVIQNADPAKKIVAVGQTYFALQTRRQELSDQETEEQRRLTIRAELKTHNSQLADAAKGSGVIEPRDYAIFQNHGYLGLYGGLGAQEIHGRKGLKKSQHILDHMGSTELAANMFRATQAEEKLRREKIVGKTNANLAHRQVGAKVRQTIHELGGTMPESLPVAESIKQVALQETLERPGVEDRDFTSVGEWAHWRHESQLDRTRWAGDRSAEFIGCD